MTIAAKILSLKQELPAYCTLVAVSKTHPADVIRQAYDAGHRIFGENKVQELLPKAEALPRDIEWHVIGHLQTNKVKYIVPFVSLIQSVDREKLLEEINKQAAKVDRNIDCLLQVHIAEEESKFGFSEEELITLVTSGVISKYNNVRVTGLMGMATFTSNHNQVRKEFGHLKTIFDQLKNRSLPENVKMNDLSMGMSGDYQLAIEAGSTMVRVGSAIFGQREYS